jgi:hypothetical protein
MYKIIFYISIAIIAGACSSNSLKKQIVPAEPKTNLSTNSEGTGPEITIEFTKGDSFYYPLLALWLEDMDSSYIQTLFVSKSIATGIFKYGKTEHNKWIPASKRAPQTLPYWSHKRGILASDGLFMPDQQTSVPDAYSGATPITDFVLKSKSDSALPDKFRVMLEINQNWDWNDYWTNDKYPGDEYYKYSCQPAVVYEAIIDMKAGEKRLAMHPIGHSHYSGKTGELFRDLSTLTTALNIADSIIVTVK